ncbi:NAD(P)/FAD-dependent oxidoreductase [Pseudonocardia sp. H11422]|uniref:NAD(P)/FAD-dependent oxidoreductase n=1 Tax=Pseudonocardia sp. H11422 TaxID=2835866 RepID=UPI0020284754|nr:NAD(P)/FAD-dependent oxidoreductase [Pseudonocardia sp. H11422]
MAREPHRVVVIGGGFGGLNATRSLAPADVDVTVVDRTNHHLFQPLLYQVAAGILPPGLIAPSLRSVIKKQRNARALLADVSDIDLEQRRVHAVGPDDRPLDLPYDTLVVAGGATHAYFGHDEWAEYAPGMKTIEDARHLRSHILTAFEMAELATDPKERAEWLTFVIIGAGPTGVELVGQVAELAHLVLPKEYRSVDTTEARILLVEGAGAVLGPFDPKLQRYTQHRLEKMGVEIRLNALAVGMDDESITIKGGGPDPAATETIRTRTRIWAAGVQASPLAAMLAARTGAETDRAGRVLVNPDCTLPGHPEVFAIGDMVSLNKLPGVAQPAIQEGRYVGKVITSRLAGDGQPRPFEYADKGSMATVGHRHAVADAFGMKVTGWIGYTMWGAVHVLYLIGWGNRLGTIYTWARGLTFSRNRGHRLITFEQANSEATGPVAPRSAPPAAGVAPPVQEQPPA